MRSHSWLFPWVLTLAWSSTPAQQLLLDIRTQGWVHNPSSYPLDLLELGNTVLFGAFDQARGGQMWRTDGTTARTQPVTASPSDVSFSFQLWTMVQTNGVVYFAGGIEGDRELWRTDGTRPGTYRIADIWPGETGSGPRYLTLAGNLVFFTADDGMHGEELWRTDGTSAGTFMVADLDPTNLPHVFELTALGNKLVFRATADREPWISDGTSAGTYRLRDINPGPASSWPYGAKLWNGFVWFAADDGTNGYELWRTDGTSAGTTLFANIGPGATSSTPQNLTSAGSLLFFSADDGTHGTELWATDGTPAGTRLVRDLVPGATGSAIRNARAFGAGIVFSADNGTGQEPWISDGTNLGTILLGDLEPGSTGSGPHAFRPFAGGALCAFRAGTSATGREVFVTNGTPAGTRLLADINPGPTHGIPEANNFVFGVIQGTLFFPADDGVHGTEPWTSDGTTAGTKLLLDIEPGQPLGSSPTFVGRIGDREYFSANDGTTTACWTTDGTAAGTTKAGFASGAFLSQLVEINDRSWYLALGPNGTELWSTDGTANGTTRAATVPGAASAAIFGTRELVAANGKLFFLVGTTLWCSDGTAGGTRALKTFNPRPLVGSPPRLYTEFAGRAFLTAEDNGGTELWASDGTVGGTLPVSNHGGLVEVSQVRVVGTRLVFVGWDPVAGTEPFVSDGTPAGTKLLLDIQTGQSSSFPRELTPVDGGVFFTAYATSNVLSLWFSDATTAGTRPVAAFPGMQLPLGLSAFGSRLLFVGVDGAGREPWISDGTPAGTIRITDIRAGIVDGMRVPSASPAFTVVGSGRVALLAANDGDHGLETWRTDGTSTGTWRVTEIGPEQVWSSPHSWLRLGSKVLFVARDITVGEEPHVMSVVATGDSLAATRVRGCPGTNGIPRLSPVGLPVLGNPGFAVRTTNGRSSTLAMLTLGTPILLPALPCTVATTHLVVIPFGLDASGAGTVPLAVPNVPALRGGELVAQTLVVDPLGSFASLLAFTNDLLLVVGD